jgi:hypothetical protein
MVKKITVCDVCGRAVNEVNKNHFSGYGKLNFDWSLGGNCGGAGDTIKKDDICCECTIILRGAIERALKDCLNARIHGGIAQR